MRTKAMGKLDPAIRHRVKHLKSVSELPTNVFLVYILLFNKKPIVVGHGKKNRAQVVFDSKEIITSHIKALTVRLHILFGGKRAVFKRCIIQCESKAEAKEIESKIHHDCGGNKMILPKKIKTKLFDGIKKRSPAWMALSMATCSAFDGISDLKRWRRNKILDNETWKQISKKLLIKYNPKKV